MLLAGDIGGTKTSLAIISPRNGARTPLAKITLPSRQYPSLQALVRDALRGGDLPVEYACFGVAGPVVNGRVMTTNLPWSIDVRELTEDLGLLSVHLLNDLAALAYAVPHLAPTDLYTLSAGEPVSGGTIGVLAPGTGLGEAFLTWDGQQYRANASEGGHTDFAPTDEQQIALLRYLHPRLGHVSYERVCSGRGLPHLYAFFRDTLGQPELPWVAEQLAAADDPTPVIIKAALATAPACPISHAALQMFVSILGAEAGNLALKVMATGGVYLGGGIPPRIFHLLADGRLLDAFTSKGRFADLLARMPVHIICNPGAALLGAAGFGLEQLVAQEVQ